MALPFICLDCTECGSHLIAAGGKTVAQLRAEQAALKTDLLRFKKKKKKAEPEEKFSLVAKYRQAYVNKQKGTTAQTLKKMAALRDKLRTTRPENPNPEQMKPLSADVGVSERKHKLFEEDLDEIQEADLDNFLAHKLAFPEDKEYNPAEDLNLIQIEDPEEASLPKMNDPRTAAERLKREEQRDRDRRQGVGAYRHRGEDKFAAAKGGLVFIGDK
eukprot:gene4865-5015_t